MTRYSPEVVAKRRCVIHMVCALVICYAVCWLPMNVVVLMSSFGKDNWFLILVFIARIFAYSNCVLNPVIYSFMSTKFKKAFNECCCCRMYPKWKGRSVRRSSSWNFSMTGPMAAMRRFSRSVSISVGRKSSVPNSDIHSFLTSPSKAGSRLRSIDSDTSI